MNLPGLSNVEKLDKYVRSIFFRVWKFGFVTLFFTILISFPLGFPFATFYEILYIFALLLLSISTFIVVSYYLYFLLLLLFRGHRLIKIMYINYKITSVIDFLLFTVIITIQYIAVMLIIGLTLIFSILPVESEMIDSILVITSIFVVSSFILSYFLLIFHVSQISSVSRRVRIVSLIFLPFYFFIIYRLAKPVYPTSRVLGILNTWRQLGLVIGIQFLLTIILMLLFALVEDLIGIPRQIILLFFLLLGAVITSPNFYFVHIVDKYPDFLLINEGTMGTALNLYRDTKKSEQNPFKGVSSEIIDYLEFALNHPN
ncbi:MAG: hypothetical protein IH840_12450 [Candidatus Heimdallarchaeota archaeon]|nr:hypothetical protein [Candidatus Heimdallarchaeota archaeon]